MANPALMLINRMKVEGFIVSEHMEVWPEALKELGTLVGTGKLRRVRRLPRALPPRPRRSWVCSKARTLASNWSSWYEAPPEPLCVFPSRGRRPCGGAALARRHWPGPRQLRSACPMKSTRERRNEVELDLGPL